MFSFDKFVLAGIVTAIILTAGTLSVSLAQEFRGEPILGLSTFKSIQLASDPDNDECLKTDGTDNIWTTDCGGGAGGSGLWSTSTDDLVTYNNTGDAVVIEGTATSSLGIEFEVNGDALFDTFISQGSSTVTGDLTLSSGQMTFDNTLISEHPSLEFFDIQSTLTANQYTLMRIKAPQVNPNEATIALLIDEDGDNSGVNESFFDWYNENYGDSYQAGLRLVDNGTARPKPIVFGHFNDDGLSKDDENKIVLLPSGTVYLGHGTATANIASHLHISSTTATNLLEIDGASGDEFLLTSSGALTLSGFDCTGNTNGGALTADASGVISCSNDDSGGGSSFGQGWEIDSNGFLAPTTTITTLFNQGFISQASSTIDAGLTITGNATITNATTTGDLNIDGGLFGASLSNCSSENMLTWVNGQFGCESDSTGGSISFGQAWEIDADGYLAPTTTITTLHNNGLIFTASSTFTGELTVASSSYPRITFRDSSSLEHPFQEYSIGVEEGPNTPLPSRSTSSAFFVTKKEQLGHATRTMMMLGSQNDSQNGQAGHIFLGGGAGFNAVANGYWDIIQRPFGGGASAVGEPVICIGGQACQDFQWTQGGSTGFNFPYASVVIGHNAASNIATSAPGIIAIGNSVLTNGGGNLEGSIAIGLSTLDNMVGDVSTGANIVIGAEAAGQLAYGSDNVCIGTSCLNNGTETYRNVCVGAGCMRHLGEYHVRPLSVEAEENTSIGDRTLLYMTGGEKNVAVGMNAGRHLSTSTNSTFIGYESAEGYIHIDDCQEVPGRLDCQQHVRNSTFLGFRSGYGIHESADNLFLGYNVGSSTRTGSGNILIGYDIATPETDTDNYLSIANLIFSDNISTTTIDATVSNANLGIGSSSPLARLSVSGDGYFEGDITTEDLTATGTITFSGLAPGGTECLQIDSSGVLATSGGGCGGSGVWEQFNGVGIRTATAGDEVVIGGTATSTHGISLAEEVVLEVDGSLYVDGEIVLGDGTSDRLYHYNDSDTYIQLANDQWQFYGGGELIALAAEGTTDQFVINELSSTINFRWESDAYNHGLFAEASTGHIAVATDTPYAPLSVWGDTDATGSRLFEVITSASTTAFAIDDNGNLICTDCIDGDDIASSYAGRSLTEQAGSPDVLNVDPEIYTETISFSFSSTTMSTTTAVAQHSLPHAISISTISCNSIGSGTTTLGIDERTSPNTTGSEILYTSGLACGPDFVNSTSTFPDDSIAADAPINLSVKDAEPTGDAANNVRITIEYTIND